MFKISRGQPAVLDYYRGASKRVRNYQYDTNGAQAKQETLFSG